MDTAVLGTLWGAVQAALALLVLLRCARPLLPAGRKAGGARPAGAVLSLALLTGFQLLLCLALLYHTPAELRLFVAVAFGALPALEWGMLPALGKKLPGDREPVILALLLSTVGLSVTASAAPEAMGKQILLLIGGLAAFFLWRALLSAPERASSLRWIMACGALGLLGLNLLLSERVWGARNWLIIAGQSLQPSEFVKVAYVYLGASITEGPGRRRELWLFAAFSALVVAALALMGDFGTALVYFLGFLLICYLQTGHVLAVGACLLAGGAAARGVLALRPYVARRFLSWGHAWDTPLGEGFQQVRAMSAAAAGGLFGRGAGHGWLRDVVAADTDLVFALVCEELGLLTALACVLSVALLALYAVGHRDRRSSFSLIAACGAVTVFLAQTALNVFGSMDMLPFTGVTFPFVSRGGSSLISCWAMLAYVTDDSGRAKPAPRMPKSPGKAARSGKTATAAGTGSKTTGSGGAKPAAAVPAKKKPAPGGAKTALKAAKPAAKPTPKAGSRPAPKPGTKSSPKTKAKTAPKAGKEKGAGK